MHIAWRISLLVIAAFLVGRITVLGISQHYVERQKQGDVGTTAKALAWNDRQPQALFSEAVALIKQDPQRAEALLRQAIDENPADTRPLLVLARLAAARAETDKADALVQEATRLMPANSAVLQDAAAYWASRGQLSQAVHYWSAALIADLSLYRRLSPLLLQIAEDPITRAVLRELALAPPPWWERFFREVARRALAIETVRTLYAMRREAPDAPLSVKERQSYIKRLQKEGLVTEAYLVWINGLTDTERRYLGLLYNGGFELELSDMGFDWHIMQAKGVGTSTATTYGAEGEKALHLAFRKRHKHYHHLFQPLFLDSGVYKLNGKVRPDSLRTLGGLKWIIRCLPNDSQSLGESERFLGTGQWREFTFEFQVPDTCEAQELRLRSAGTRPTEKRMSGEIWFDALSIRKIKQPPMTTGIEQRSAPLPQIPSPVAGEG